MSNSFIFDDLVIYAGEIAKEFHQELPSKLAEIKTIFVRGKNDTIIKEDRINNIIKLYDGCNYSFIEFDGGHEVTVEMVNVLLQQKV